MVSTREGTRDYQAYGRDHEIIVAGRPSIPGSSDPAFRGDPSRGNGRFAEVVLRPTVVIKPGGSVDVALNLHARAHEFCFIANSVNFPVLCEAAVDVVSA